MAENVDLRTIPIGHLNTAVASLVPYPSASESLALLANPWPTRSTAPVTVNLNPQIINAVKSTIVQNIQGTLSISELRPRGYSISSIASPVKTPALCGMQSTNWKTPRRRLRPERRQGLA